MTRRTWSQVIAVATTALMCAVISIPRCTRLGPCVAQEVAGAWGSVLGSTALFLGAGLLLAWMGRLLHLADKARCVAKRLPVQEYPGELKEAVVRTGNPDVTCIAADLPLAFCVGLLRPRIYVSRAAVLQLRPEELQAVLLHELYHARRRDPLRNAASVALRDVCFFLPLIDWLAQYQQENIELAADLAAINVVGPTPVAGALWVLGTSSTTAAMAAFTGRADLRVAQVLGDPVPSRVPPGFVWVASAIGVLSVLVIVSCLLQQLPHSLGPGTVYLRFR